MRSALPLPSAGGGRRVAGVSQSLLALVRCLAVLHSFYHHILTIIISSYSHPSHHFQHALIRDFRGPWARTGAASHRRDGILAGAHEGGVDLGARSSEWNRRA
jgi:hypothetical protein